MVRSIIKKMLALMMIVACVAGMAFNSNAYTISFGSNYSHGYSSSKIAISYTERSSNLTSVGFNGLTPGAFPSNKYVCVRLFGSKNSNDIQSSAAVHYSLGSKYLVAYSTGNRYIGAYTNASVGATIGVTV